MSINDLVNLCIGYVLEAPARFFAAPTIVHFIICTWLVFVVVYRWNIQRHLRYKVFTKSNSKLLKCETCFAFWLCLLISTNLTTAAAAYLLFNFYEKD